MKHIGLIIFALLVLGFKTSEEKKYSISLTVQQWSLILEVIDKSNAPHQQVKMAQDLLVPELNRQIADTTKK